MRSHKEVEGTYLVLSRTWNKFICNLTVIDRLSPGVLSECVKFIYFLFIYLFIYNGLTQVR